MRFFIFATIFISVFTLLNIYINKRLINKLDIKEQYKKYFRYFLIFNLLGIVGYLFARYNPTIPNWLYFALSLPVGILFLLFCTAIIYDLSRKVVVNLPISKSRRRFFKKSLDISSLVVATSLTARSLYEARYIEIEKIDIKIKNLKKSYKIVQLSDVHIGGLIDKDFISELVEKVNKLKPDLVVITGDLIDVALEYAIPSLEELSKLKSKYGTYFCVGNHEYLHNIEAIIKEVKKHNIIVLENENVYIGDNNFGFNLAGVYDVMGDRIGKYKPDLNKALKNKKDSPTILLAHQPRYISEVKDVDLMLSGHTHGGQIYPFRLLVKLVQPYLKGLYQHNEDLQIYVNKGTGYWGPPMRLGASSEITVITLL
ncbi:MAG: metallophosphoesterase [Campylobacterota bacterium]|nr:metallophosphoesterase [Campylobacterota bacterium]